MRTAPLLPPSAGPFARPQYGASELTVGDGSATLLIVTATINEPTDTTVHLSYALQRYQSWRTDEAGCSPATWAGEKAGLLSFVDCMVARGKHYPATLTFDDLTVWWSLQSTLADSTRATRLHQVRSFLGHCVKRGWAQSDPSSLLTAKRPIPTLRERLTANELLALIEAAADHSARDRILVALAVNLGLRASEITNLLVRDVRLEDGQIRVQIPKTSEADEMPVTQDLDRELRRWLHTYSDGCPDVGRTSYLVPSVYRSAAEISYRHDRRYTEPWKAVQRALDRLGWEVTAKEGVHTVRRSVARLLFDDVEQSATFDSALLVTQSFLHHSRPETTLTYIGRDRQTLARDRMLRGKPFLTRLAKDATVLRSAV